MVRRVTNLDLPAVAKLVVEFYDKADMSHIGLTPEYWSVYTLLETMLGDGRYVMLVDEQETIIGGIMGVVKPWEFNVNQVVLQEMGWFVKEDYRKKYPRSGLKLLHGFIKAGKERGANHLIISASERPEQEKVLGLYRKMNLHPKDVNYIGRI